MHNERHVGNQRLDRRAEEHVAGTRKCVRGQEQWRVYASTEKDGRTVELDPIPRVSVTKNELRISRLSKVMVLHIHTCRQTDRQTDRHADRRHRSYYQRVEGQCRSSTPLDIPTG